MQHPIRGAAAPEHSFQPAGKLDQNGTAQESFYGAVLERLLWGDHLLYFIRLPDHTIDTTALGYAGKDQPAAILLVPLCPYIAATAGLVADLVAAAWLWCTWLRDRQS